MSGADCNGKRSYAGALDKLLCLVCRGVLRCLLVALCGNADVADFAARSEAIVLTNPPYGERMSTIEGAAKLAKTLGQQMEAHPCAGVYAITADMDFEHHYGKRANKRRKMYNGMIPCQLYMYYNAPKFENRPAKPMPKSGFDGKRTQPGHTGRFEKK